MALEKQEAKRASNDQWISIIVTLAIYAIEAIEK